jgi:drug/metabolite transporter (DMT)-like permease
VILGGLPLLALSAVREPDALPRLLHDGLSLQDVGLLSYVSLLGGAVAYGLFFRAAAQGSLVRLSALTFLTPLFAALCGYAALGETLTQQQLCGAGITLVGVLLVNRRQSSGGDN